MVFLLPHMGIFLFSVLGVFGGMGSTIGKLSFLVFSAFFFVWQWQSITSFFLDYLLAWW